jgi:hypothetical protein
MWEPRHIKLPVLTLASLQEEYQTISCTSRTEMKKQSKIIEYTNSLGLTWGYP